MTGVPNLNRLRYFTAVFEAGSFTAAGHRLGVAKTVVSHQVAQLEAELRSTLFVRNTRKLQPTESGQRFYQHASAILRDAEEAFGELAQAAEEPIGTLSITAPIEYGQAIVAPVVTDYLRRFPHMTVEIDFGDTLLDLVESNVDVAVRAGWLEDSGHKMRRLGTFTQILVCAPPVAERLPRDLTPQAAASLPWIGNRALKRPLDWVFERAGEQVTVTAKAVIMANLTPATLACALAGAGLAVLPDFMAEPEIRARRLVPLLTDWSLPAGGIYAVYPSFRFRPAKVRLFVDMLEQAERERHQRR